MSKTVYKRNKSKSLADFAYQQIRSGIMHGYLKPGDKLRLEKLCERYDIGMSPLREALSRLCGDALVINESQRGFWVATLSIEEFEDIISVTVILATEALQRSIKNADEVWENNLRDAFEQLHAVEKHYGSGDIDHEQWSPANSRFHEALIAANDSPWLRRILQTLYQQSDRYRMITQVGTQVDSETYEEHLAMFEAAINRNILKLCRLSEKHMLHLVDSVRATLT